MMSRGRSQLVLVALVAAPVLAGAATWWIDSSGRSDEPRGAFVPPSRATRLAAIGPTTKLSPSLKRLFSPDTGRFLPMSAPEAGEWLERHAESGQTFEAYLAEKPHRADGRRRTIYLLPIGEFDDRVAPDIERLREYAAVFFRLPVKVLPRISLDGSTLERRVHAVTGKRQFLTAPLLSVLRRKLPKDGYCLLGVTMEDLYPGEDWNFVFGQASLKRRVGVYSFARNHPSFFGETAGPKQRIDTFRQAAHTLVHETAHMFGMRHCIFYRCVVNGSNSLEESRKSPLHLCPVCLRKLHWATRTDLLERYRRLRAFYARAGLDAESKWVADRLERVGAGAR